MCKKEDAQATRHDSAPTVSALGGTLRNEGVILC